MASFSINVFLSGTGLIDGVSLKYGLEAVMLATRWVPLVVRDQCLSRGHHPMPGSGRLAAGDGSSMSPSRNTLVGYDQWHPDAVSEIG
jgi:hypothetical protein